MASKDVLFIHAVVFSSSFDLDVTKYQEWLKQREFTYNNEEIPMTETVSWACDALWENVIITSSIKVNARFTTE